MSAPIPFADRDHFLAHLGQSDDWTVLQGRTWFLTGASGFFGRWLLETFFAANDVLGLGARCLALTRNAARLRNALGPLAERSDLALLEGRTSSFAFPAEGCAAVIHAAVEYTEPLPLFDEAVTGTRRVLEYARRSGTERFLFVSSGAMYGRQPPLLMRIPETWSGGPDPGIPAAAYAEAKRVGEFLCGAYHAKYGLGVVRARAFAFLGPHQPLDLGAAIGSFLRDALAGRTIRGTGDGTPLRSYLYAADLALWLWRLLLRGVAGRAYNVGGDEAISIRDLAYLVAEVVAPGTPVEFAHKPTAGVAPERYLPDLARVRDELALAPRIGLREAISRTAAWHRALTTAR